MRYRDDQRHVTDGPFAETKELIAGYTLVQVQLARGSDGVGEALRPPSPSGMTARSSCARCSSRRTSGTWWRRCPRCSRPSGRSRRSRGGDCPLPGPSPPRREREHLDHLEALSPGFQVALSVVPMATDLQRDHRRGLADRVAPRLIAGLTRVVRDVGLAEELAQDALVAALEQWPDAGVPDNPGAWLMRPASTAPSTGSAAAGSCAAQARRDRPRDSKRSGRRRDSRPRCGPRRRRRRRPAAPDLHRLPPGAGHRGARGADAAAGRRAHDRGDRARLPRAGADDGAAHRAGQAHAGARRACRFEVPRGEELAARLARCWRSSTSIFNEGYSATAGDDWMRPALCEEALRLGRILAASRPTSPRCMAWSR